MRVEVVDRVRPALTLTLTLTLTPTPTFTRCGWRPTLTPTLTLTLTPNPNQVRVEVVDSELLGSGDAESWSRMPHKPRTSD